MTSLDFFPPINVHNKVLDWGTGKLRGEKTDCSANRGPVFFQTNLPIEQYYDLTTLRRSNLRSNDELTPRPTQISMTDYRIDLPFPAEHPYASHQPRFAVFPKFSDSPDDPRTGTVATAGGRPRHAEASTRPNDLKVVKTKGHSMREEVMSLPQESLRQGTQWPGDNFEQRVKGGSYPAMEYYPIPPKMIVPNQKSREGTEIGSVSSRTANAARNVERDQWRPTYTRDFTGLGTANPPKLDNLEEKKKKFLSDGVVDDSLHPRSVKTFDPARPEEGRTARILVPRETSQPVVIDKPQSGPEFRRANMLDAGNKRPSLLDYDRMVRDQQWRVVAPPHNGVGPPQNPQSNAQPERPSSAPGFKSYLSPEEEEKEERLEKFKQLIQQMEAEDRWRLLESEGPAHDITQWRHKNDSLPWHPQDKPKAFHDHEGRFQTERAGLYRTSYLPETLSAAMSGLERSGRFITDTSQSHEDAISYPTRLNGEVRDTVRGSHYYHTNAPSVVPLGVDAIRSQHAAQRNQRALLEPEPHRADPRTQEGGFVETISEKSSNYDINKFLQEYELPKYSRYDPLRVLSSENGVQLNPVRYGCTKRRPRSVHFADDVIVAHGYGDQPSKISSEPLNQPLDHLRYSLDTPRWIQSSQLNGTTSSPFTGRRLVASAEGPLIRDQFESKATNYGTLSGEYCQSGVCETPRNVKQYEPLLNLAYKEDDPRFRWQPGTPRPGSNILELQDGFSKSEVRRRFREMFPENPPPLKDNITDGRRHTIMGLNSQVLHG